MSWVRYIIETVLKALLIPLAPLYKRKFQDVFVSIQNKKGFSLNSEFYHSKLYGIECQPSGLYPRLDIILSKL